MQRHTELRIADIHRGRAHLVQPQCNEVSLEVRNARTIRKMERSKAVAMEWVRISPPQQQRTTLLLLVVVKAETPRVWSFFAMKRLVPHSPFSHRRGGTLEIDLIVCLYVTWLVHPSTFIHFRLRSSIVWFLIIHYHVVWGLTHYTIVVNSFVFYVSHLYSFMKTPSFQFLIILCFTLAHISIDVVQ